MEEGEVVVVPEEELEKRCFKTEGVSWECDVNEDEMGLPIAGIIVEAMERGGKAESRTGEEEEEGICPVEIPFPTTTLE